MSSNYPLELSASAPGAGTPQPFAAALKNCVPRGTLNNGNVQRLRRFAGCLLALAGVFLGVGCLAAPATPAADFSAKLTPLIDPAKLATLAKRGANPRLQKAVAILAEAEANGHSPGTVIDAALQSLASTNKAADSLTRAALLTNLAKAAELGCLNGNGLAAMRRGNSPTASLGDCAGQKVVVDHLIPFAVAPELGNVIANLRLLPAKENASKLNNVGARALALAEQFHRAGLLSAEALERIKQRTL
jgi:hypothetical protein